MPKAQNICPKCGQAVAVNAPMGLCPECLLEAGLPAGTETASAGTAGLNPPFVAPSASELARLFPKLEILALLGQGGMGAVYQARQRELDRTVALKILPPGRGQDSAFAERFAREARALARLNHPGIVQLYEYGQANGLFYFLMEFVDGASLRQLLNAGRISPREALAIVPQLCDALQYAHDQGIVHRDIKPENILLDRRGRPKVADFGVAKLVGAAGEPQSGATPAASALTGAGKVIGTRAYMAPEQLDHPGAVDHRADIYALGVVFYQMLTGELPAGQFTPPSRKLQIDVRLDEVLLQALEKEPQRRYQHISQIKTAVESISAASGSPGSPPDFPHHPLRWRDRWSWDPRFAWLLLGVSAVAGMGGAGALYPFWGSRALLLLLVTAGGGLFALYNSVAGAQVRGLWKALPADATDAAEALLVKDATQQPGLAVLRKEALELIPILGNATVIPLENIRSVRTTKWLNGKWLFAKLVLVLERAGSTPVGVGLPEPIALAWKPRLEAKRDQAVPERVMRWRDLWIWSKPKAALFIWIPMAFFTLLALALVPLWGPWATLLMLCEVGGVPIAAYYFWIGFRLQRLRAARPRSDTDIAEALMVIQNRRRPGLAILHQDSLELVPLSGASLTVPLANIMKVTEVRSLQRRPLWRKGGFALELAGGERVSFAVPEPVARHWRACLNRQLG